MRLNHQDPNFDLTTEVMLSLSQYEVPVVAMARDLGVRTNDLTGPFNILRRRGLIIDTRNGGKIRGRLVRLVAPLTTKQELECERYLELVYGS
jgi:hypothetical protein